MSSSSISITRQDSPRSVVGEVENGPLREIQNTTNEIPDEDVKGLMPPQLSPQTDEAQQSEKDISWEFDFDFRASRPSTAPKSEIQLKLEQWKRPKASEKELQKKLEEATKRRSRQNDLVVQKRKEHLSHVNDTASHINAKKNAESMSRISTLQERARQAEENKAKLTNLKLQKLNAKHIQTAERITTKKQTDEQALIALEGMLNQKAEAAQQRKDQHLTDTLVSKLNQTLTLKKVKGEEVRNNKDQKAKSLEMTMGEKLSNAMDRRAQALSNLKAKLTSELKSKQERGAQTLEARNTNVSLKKDQLETKLVEAAERKDNVLADKTSSLSAKLKTKQERGLQVKETQAADVSAKKERMETKLAEATERKVNALGAQTASLSLELRGKQERGLQSVEARDADLLSKRQQQDTKLAGVVERKERGLSKLKEELAEKLKAKEDVGKESSAAKDAAVSLKKKEIEDKMSNAVERKESTLSKLTSSLSDKLKSKQDRGAKSKLARAENQEHLKDELDDKMNGAAARKDELQAEKVKSVEEKHSSMEMRVETLRKKHENVRMQIYSKHKKRLISASHRKQNLKAKPVKESNEPFEEVDNFLLLAPIDEESIGSRNKEEKLVTEEQTVQVIPDDPRAFRNLLNSGMYMDLNPSIRSDNSALSFDTRPSTAGSMNMTSENPSLLNYCKDKLESGLFPSRATCDDDVVSYSTEIEGKKNSIGNDDGTKETMSISTNDDLFSLDTTSIRDSLSGHGQYSGRNRGQKEAEEPKVNLSSEDFMRSLALAEEAAKSGMSEFTTESKLKVLERVELSETIQRTLKRQERRKQVEVIVKDSRRVVGNAFKRLREKAKQIDRSRNRSSTVAVR